MEKGKYEEAFKTSYSRTAGKKNKKKENIKILEESYARLHERDNTEIKHLDPQNYPENYPKVLDILQQMDKRQGLVKPMMPVVSKEGYRGKFEFEDYRPLIKDATKGTGLYYIEHSKELLTQTKQTGDHLPSRKALEELLLAEKYVPNESQIYALKQEALDMGTIYVYLSVNSMLPGLAGTEAERRLSNLPVSQLDDKWHKFTSFPAQKPNRIDVQVAIELIDVSISPERETVQVYKEQKEILVRKDKSKEVKDSASVDVIKEVYELVSAEIKEIKREKSGVLNGEIKITNQRNRQSMGIIPIHVTSDFRDLGYIVHGDERALSPESKAKTKKRTTIFPSDFDIIMSMTDEFSKSIMNELRNFKYQKFNN